MPRIPKRDFGRTPGSINLGRVQETGTSVSGELARQQQFDQIVKGGLGVADALLANQDKKRRETSDLKVNEAFLSFQASSIQAEDEFQNTLPADSDGLFLRFKEKQDLIWQNSSEGLTPEERTLFNQRAASFGLEQNMRVSRLESSLTEARIDQNYQASATAANLNAFKNIAQPTLFYSNLNESRRLTNELLARKGVNKTEIDNKDRIYASDSVKRAILLSSSISLPSAEKWYKEALEREELTTNDSLIVKNALDKRKAGMEQEMLLSWSQAQADSLMSIHGEDRKLIFEEIERKTSGKQEEALKKEIGIRMKQLSDQRAEDQRAFLQRGKIIIDQADNATEARKQVDFIMSDQSASIDTAKKLGKYIEDVFEKSAARKVTNVSKMDELYTNINKTFSGVASNDEVIASVDDLLVKYGPYLTVADQKKASEYYRNGGLFNQTSYDSLLQSFANMKGTTVAKTRQNKDFMTEFAVYLDYARPLLPSDKTVTPFELQKISADFFMLREREGETLRSPESILRTTGFDKFEDQTYIEAANKGEGLFWLPDLSLEDKEDASRLLAQENETRRLSGRPVIPNTDKNLSIIFKQRVLRLPYKERL